MGVRFFINSAVWSKIWQSSFLFIRLSGFGRQDKLGLKYSDLVTSPLFKYIFNFFSKNLFKYRGKRRRKRDESSSNEIEPNFELKDSSFDSEHPFLTRINEIGFEQMRSSPECQKRIFCEMSKFGANQENANTIQKIFHYLSLV